MKKRSNWLILLGIAALALLIINPRHMLLISAVLYNFMVVALVGAIVLLLLRVATAKWL